MSGRTVWIVDAAYLMKASPGRIDYLLLRNALEERLKRTFVEAYYVDSAPSPPTEQQESYYTWLKSAPPRGPKMRVRLHRLKGLQVECPGCHVRFERNVQQGVDVAIATLIVKLSAQNQYDTLLLSAGDGDFEDAVQYVKEELHKEVWLTGFEGKVSADLQSYADEVIWLNELWPRIRKPVPAPVSGGSILSFPTMPIQPQAPEEAPPSGGKPAA
jgi:nijmegen breakage syndrome protein 1